MKSLFSFTFVALLCFVTAETTDEDNSKIFLGSYPSTSKSHTWSKTDKVIFDTDGGLSDITALLILLRAYAKKLGPPVIAVTITRRELLVKVLGRNIARALRLAGREDIPYYLGADYSLVSTPVITARRFGQDALGDVPYNPYGLPEPQKEFAPIALIKLVLEADGDAVIITCGALTNIALAIKLFPPFLSHVKKIIIGAGAVRGIGNARPGIEYKAWRDPEALKIIVDNSYFKNTFMVVNDGVFELDEAIPVEFWMSKYYTIQDPFIQFIREASQVYWNGGALEGYALGDPVIVSSYLEPKLVESVEPRNITVSISNDCRGAIFGGVTDFTNWKADRTASNVQILDKLNAKVYVQFLLKLANTKYY